MVTLSIKDQGHGIPPDVMKQIGTPFVTTKEEGTGLGIAVCLGIAARNNAHINLETCEQGTTFYINFPLV